MNRSRLLSVAAPKQLTTSVVFTLAACYVLLLVFVTPASADSLRRSAIVQAVETVRPSVVNITGQKLVPRDDQFSREKKRVNGMGTGVVVDSRGYILTNYHVVEGVRRIRVTHANGQAYIARLVAHDPSTDLAIIKIPVKYHMQVVKVGSSRDIMTGETVIAVGNAYGYEHTVTTGIVSAQHRNVQVNEVQSYQNLIQTDASINPGNSGGPLLNIDGNMIGINVAVRVGAQGIGFAIPVDEGMQVAAKLMSLERIAGLWHGVIHEDTIVENQQRVVIRHVQPGSPAEKAGLQDGDVIRQVAGKQVGRGLDLECALIGTHAGDSVAFAVNRDNQNVDVQVGIAAKQQRTTTKPRLTHKKKTLQDTAVHTSEWDVLGVRVELVKEAEISKFTDRFRGGLRVLSLKPDGLAEASGIQTQDILVGMHVWETVTKNNLEYVLNEADLAEVDSIPFYVVRSKKTLSGKFEVSELR